MHIRKYYKKEINPQKKFEIPNINSNNLRTVFVDFYLPEDNIIIEYDGEQHYNYVEYFHKTFSDFEDQVNRDCCLVNYCKENNIKLLRIPWKDNSRLEEVVREFLINDNDISTKINHG